MVEPWILGLWEPLVSILSSDDATPCAAQTSTTAANSASPVATVSMTNTTHTASPVATVSMTNATHTGSPVATVSMTNTAKTDSVRRVQGSGQPLEGGKGEMSTSDGDNEVDKLTTSISSHLTISPSLTSPQVASTSSSSPLLPMPLPSLLCTANVGGVRGEEVASVVRTADETKRCELVTRSHKDMPLNLPTLPAAYVHVILNEVLNVPHFLYLSYRSMYIAEK